MLLPVGNCGEIFSNVPDCNHGEDDDGAETGRRYESGKPDTMRS